MSLIFSIGFVSATDLNDTTTDIVTQSSEMDLTDINTEDNLEISSDTQISSQEENSRVIYVGQNKTTDGGNGSQDNPFNSFELACNNLNGEEKAEINVYNGTYYLDSDLKFNTSNLFINGMGDVVIKNLRNEPRAYASFGLTSSSGNFTFSNLTFDGSNCIYIHANSDRHFFVFNGNANLGIFNNCSFINFNEAMMFTTMNNKKFNYCNFLGSFNYLNVLSRSIFGTEFNYCVLSSGLDLGGGDYNIPSYMTFNNVWLGQNDYPNYIKYRGRDDGGYMHNLMWPVNKHAIFSSWENYMGNDTFEILGKLTWDDGTTEGIEKLYPLTVYFSSKTGELPQNTTLVNGTFNVIYKSESKDNHIEVTLDSEDIFLDFKNDIQVTAKPIIYGEDQNITITLPQSSQGIAYISVNNQTYEYQVNGSSLFNFTIPDELLAGTYQATVKLIDNITHLYGQGNVEWKISQIDKELLIQTPADANVDDENIIITILLEDDETGNITVSVGDKNKSIECFGGNIDIDILDLLVGGNNNIKVVYSGNKKYISQTKYDEITVNRINPKMNIKTPTNPRIFEKININITLPTNATGNITISTNNKNKTITELNTLNVVDISDLLIGGSNTVYIRYSGDNWWDTQTRKITINVAKLTPSMDIYITPTAVRLEENFTIKINLPQNSTGKILIKTNEKNYQINLTDVLTAINLSSNISGLNKINITYTGDDNYYSISKTVNVTVKIDSSLTAAPVTTTYNVTKDLVVTLTDVDSNVLVNKTVNVIVGTINKNLTTNASGQVSVDVSGLLPNSYFATISFAGDDEYVKSNASAKIVVNKINSLLTATPVITTYQSGNNLIVSLTDVNGRVLVNKTVNVIVGTIDINLTTNTSGQVSVYVSDLIPNGYTANIAFEGDEYYNETNTTTNVIINKGIPDVNISYEGDLSPDEKLIIKAEISYATGNVTIIVNGDKNTTKLVNNVATYTIDKLTAGTYYVTVLYEGNDLFDFAYKTDSFDVVKSTADLINELNNTVNTQENTINNQIEQISNLNDTVNNQTGIIDSQKEQISNLNDTVNAQENIINSQVEQINNLTDTVNTQAGTIDSQKEQISVLNDTVNNQSCTMDSQINEINALNDTVKAQNSTIESQKDLINNLNETIIEQNKTINNVSNPVATSILVKNIATTATTVKYFTISLIDASNNLLANKTIKFTVNGKTNTVTTNGSGIATVKVSYNTAGTRYYTFSFLGELGYSASIASAKVVVNKKATKLTAPKKTFKVKTKTKKVQLKLTTGKKALKSKKITLKVKGKTYTAKTNKKGIATFKITKLTKKGTFKYTVKFAGDKAYKATNKNGKITIK